MENTTLEQPGWLRNVVPAPVSKAVTPPNLRTLNVDESLTSIFYAVWTGPLAYGIARKGFDWSVAASLAVGAGVFAATYNQWWKMALGQYTSGFAGGVAAGATRGSAPYSGAHAQI